MVLSSVSTDLFLLAVFFAVGYTDATIPEGVYGEVQGASQVDPTGGGYRVKIGTPVTSAGECKQLISVDGFMVADEVELPCDTFPVASADKRVLIVGDALYAESSLPGTLYQVKGQTCEKFTYEHLPDTLNIDASPVTQEECREIRRKMKKLLTELYKKATGDNSQLWTQASQRLDQIYGDLEPSPKPKPAVSNVSNNNNAGKPAVNGNNNATSAQNNKTYDVGISKPFSLNGKTVKNVTVTGPGIVSDVITVDASEPTDVIKTKDKLVVGHFLLSKEPGKIVVVKDNRCIQRTYAKNGTLQTKDLSDGECEAVRMEIRKAEKEPSQFSSEIVGQVSKPVNESIRLIVNYLTQIINIILNFIRKNVKNMANNNELGALETMASGFMKLASKLGRRQNGNQSGQNSVGGPTYGNNAGNPNSGIYGLPGVVGLANSAGVNYGRPGVSAPLNPWYTGGTANGFNGFVSNPMNYMTRSANGQPGYGLKRPDEENEAEETGLSRLGGFLNMMNMHM